MYGFKAAGVGATAFLLTALPALCAERAAVPTPRPEGWLVKSLDELKSPAPSATELKARVAKGAAADVERAGWWSVGGPTYRWNEIAVDELIDNFVTLPLAARHLALLHAAMDDAVAVAWHNKQAYSRPRPGPSDPPVKPALAVPGGSVYPSDYAAAAAAASEVLSYIFPSRAAARAEEVMQSRLLADVEHPSDVAAGRAIGQRIAALAITRGRADGSDGKWIGSVPDGPGKWTGTNPIAPPAATWGTWAPEADLIDLRRAAGVITQYAACRDLASRGRGGGVADCEKHGS